MYQGNNPIALQSREWLIQALLELMEEMPYSKITILTICRRADLSRQTFYHFFRDKEDILHFYFRRIYQQYFRSLERQQEGSLTLGDLPRGKWRYLTEAEVNALR